MPPLAASKRRYGNSRSLNRIESFAIFALKRVTDDLAFPAKRHVQ
jgi:hypothetical protein